MKVQFTFLLAAALCGSVAAQSNTASELDLSNVVVTVQAWAEENLDEDFLASLGELDEQRVRQFLEHFEQRLRGEYVLDLAALQETARAILPLLDVYEETQPYAVWLRSRLDYLDVAQELRTVTPMPKTQPGKAALAPPQPSLDNQRKVWTKQIQQRPMPKGAEKLVPQLKEVFASERVPTELVWLAEVESSFNRRAKSPVGAAGLFQLMPATAERFGLRTWPFDQRYQVEPSARAAAQYLRILHGQFKSWPLAVAAYNAGEGRVGGLLEKHRPRSYEGIAARLPAETQMYVPKVEATLLRREGVKLAVLRPPRA